MKIFKTALQDGDVILDDMQSFAGAFDKEVATEWIEELVMAAHITKSTGQLNTAVAKSKETSTVDATRGQVRAEVLHLSFLILGQAKDTSNTVFSPAEHQGAILVVDEAKENHLSCSTLASDLPVCVWDHRAPDPTGDNSTNQEEQVLCALLCAWRRSDPDTIHVGSSCRSRLLSSMSEPHAGCRN